MPRREIGKENVRKLQRTGEGGGSYMLTLPKEIVKRLGWQEHQKVVVHEEGGKISIEDWEAN